MLTRHSFLSILLVACSRTATKDEAIGAYAMNKGKAHDTLVVYSNGSYVLRYTAPGTVAVVDTGRWTWDTTNNEQFLTFEKFIPRWRAEFAGPARLRPGFWLARPERSFFGTITIPVVRDVGWAYVHLPR
jgi:hypothetical protein